MNIDVVVQYQDLVNARWRDPVGFGDRLRGVLTPQVVCREAASLPWGGEWRGYDGFVELFDTVEATFAAAAGPSGNAPFDVDAGPATYSRLEDGGVLRRYDLVLISGERRREIPCMELYSFDGPLICGIDVFFFDSATVGEMLTEGSRDL